MRISPTLKQALRSSLVLQKHHTEPLWARLLVGGALALAVALALLMASVFLMAQPEMKWWNSSISDNLVLGTCAATTMLLLIRVLEWLLPSAWIDALFARHDWRPVVLMSTVLFAGAALGVRAGFGLLGQLHDFDMWGKFAGVPLIQLKFLIFVVVILAANWVWWLLRAKEKALAQQAAESQLRMLQAQIEPHFLFNTLANVQSLIASDPPRAQLMLESFTDYLRASLGQMRANDSSVAAELETARNYLQLMQIRMGNRLTFSIEASDAARQALLPPLLLQPLVENAVQHGIDPKLEGGSVCVTAHVRDGTLEIRVDDDGVGIEHARPSARAGNGVALKNVSTRLETRFGTQASLSIEALNQGTRASMALPFRIERTGADVSLPQVLEVSRK